MTSIRIPAQLALFFAWLIALIATLATLYASEIAKIPVCPLCWEQRISIYPFAIILGIACYRNDLNIRIYTFPWMIIGALIGLYQYLMQMIPGFGPIELCGVGFDCSAIHLKLLGFITFPFLSMVASIAIVVLLLLGKN